MYVNRIIKKCLNQEPLTSSPSPYIITLFFLVAFRRAAASGDLSTVQRLVDEQDISVNCAGRNGVTALHKAAENSQISIIRFLARRGAHLSPVGGVLGGTPLHHAAYWGQPRAVQQLLRLGCEINKADQNGKTAEEVARDRGQEAIVTMLVNATVTSDETTKPKPSNGPDNSVTVEADEAGVIIAEKPTELIELEKSEKQTESEPEPVTEKEEEEEITNEQIENELLPIVEDAAEQIESNVSTLMIKIAGMCIKQENIYRHYKKKNKAHTGTHKRFLCQATRIDIRAKNQNQKTLL